MQIVSGMLVLVQVLLVVRQVLEDKILVQENLKVLCFVEVSSAEFVNMLKIITDISMAKIGCSNIYALNVGLNREQLQRILKLLTTAH